MPSVSWAFPWVCGAGSPHRGQGEDSAGTGNPGSCVPVWWPLGSPAPRSPVQRGGCWVSVCFTYMCNLWWQTRKIRSPPYNVCLSWHLTQVNKLIIHVGYNLLFFFCYTLGPKAIQTSEANFSLNNSKKVRLGLSGRRWTIEASRSLAMATCPAGCFSANTASGRLASGSSSDRMTFSL